jgi:hypothetical protein
MKGRPVRIDRPQRFYKFLILDVQDIAAQAASLI